MFLFIISSELVGFHKISGEGFTLAHSLRAQVIRVEKVWEVGAGGGWSQHIQSVCNFLLLREGLIHSSCWSELAMEM